MPNPQEIDPETREALARLGFERNDAGDVAFVRRLAGRTHWIWMPGVFRAHSPNLWVADTGYSVQALENGAGQLFDDPISAAVWLNVEASHG